MAQIADFLKKNWLLVLLPLIGLILKSYDIGLRPMHHDESLHAQYGKYFANSFTSGFYKYDPLLHGPLLYHLQGFWTWLAGPLTKDTVRFIPLACGFVLSLVPLALTSRIPKSTLLFLSLFLSLSPTFTYWSRFIRHDSLVFLSLAITSIALINRDRLTPYWIGLALGIHFCAKENIFVHIVLMLGFFIAYWIIHRPKLHINQRDLAKALIVFLVFSIPIYTAYFQYPQGFLDGLYRKSLSYWINQHHTERITGPFYFNALLMSVYETWVLIPLAIFARRWFLTQPRRWFGIDLAFILGALLLSFFIPKPMPQFMSVWLKVKNPIDIFVFLIPLYFSLRVTFQKLVQKQNLAAFFCYLAFSMFFTYSYLGEKVPWLALYPTIAFVVLVSFSMNQWTRLEKILTVAAFILCFPKTLYINHVVPGSEKELISQVHTTYEYENLMLRVQSSLLTPPGLPKPRVLVVEDNGWPLSWYLWGLSGVEYAVMKSSFADYDYVFDSYHNPKTVNKLSLTHQKHKLAMRQYWWPNFNDLTFNRWVQLAFLHRPWSESGYFDIAVWVANGVPFNAE